MTADRRRIEHVLFDLGGVLVDFRGVSSLAVRLGLDHQLMAKQWLASPSVRAYERGLTDTETFISGVLTELDGVITDRELRAEMTQWLPGTLPGALELLRDLADAGVAHSCLSNTNSFHWPLMQSWGIHRTFTHAFLSHELGMVKPDSEIFEAVMASLGLEPDTVVFFDDHPTNVAAASEFGLIGVEASGPATCRTWLQQRGLLRR